MSVAELREQLVPGWLRQLKRDYLWRAKERELRGLGIDVRGFPRVEEFVRTRFRLEEPNYVHPLQKPTGFIRSLTSMPWHDPTDYSWVPSLEDNHSVIQDELKGLLDSGRFLTQHQGIATDGQWNVFYLYNYGDKIEENCALCPETTRLVEAIPGAARSGRIFFSAMTAGTIIHPHCAPANTRLRCHLGLVVPEGCGIRVGEESRNWEEGRCIIIDDTYEHDTWNRSDRTRIVLIIDFWHPDLSMEEAELIRKLIMLRPGVLALSEAIRGGDNEVKDDEWWS